MLTQTAHHVITLASSHMTLADTVPTATADTTSFPFASTAATALGWIKGIALFAGTITMAGCGAMYGFSHAKADVGRMTTAQKVGVGSLKGTAITAGGSYALQKVADAASGSSAPAAKPGALAHHLPAIAHHVAALAPHVAHVVSHLA